MEQAQATRFEIGDERVAWEGLAASCTPPLRRLGAFLLVGFAYFAAITTAVVLFYNLFGTAPVEGGGVAVPKEAFYATMISSLGLALGGYAVWLVKSLRSYWAFSSILRRGGLDPGRPTARGLVAYSDEQLLALRSRYERRSDGKLKERLGRTFGFEDGDSFSLGPLSVLPGTFEMGALRVEWETNLLLRAGEPMPEISWWTESRTGLLPRQADETRRLVYALRYTADSVRELKRRYGYRTDRWHATVPEGKLFGAIRDYEESLRIQASLSRMSRG
ncbi:MAG TPA: hypothetical protein VHH10_02585 [Rubrobacteraceae bacterium]|jgi:hypothetical protein|nr:hypothetical protein [Rubrobacteraceae bacterium]